MTAKVIESKAASLIADNLSAMGFELVRVKVMAGGSFATLQIMAERADGKGMTVEDCVAISHAVSEKLDADKEMADFTLEVSSPGIDRPLVQLKDFERFTGHLAAIELEAAMQPPTEGHKPRKRFKGSIVRIAGNAQDAEIEFSTDNGALHVPMSNIVSAKLVLTDDLINLHSRGKSN
jgi:ribosome maturation factor RimP